MNPWQKIILANTALSFLCGLPAAFAAESQPSSSPIPIIEFKAIPLAAAIENLAREAQLNCLTDAAVAAHWRGTNKSILAEPTVSGRWENLSAAEVLARLLKERGLFAIANPQTGVTRIAMTNLPPRVFEQNFISGKTNEVIPLIVMAYVPFDIGLNNLAQKAGIKLELPPEIVEHKFGFPYQSFPSVRWEKLTARQALAAVCESYHFRLSKGNQPDTWRLALE